LIVAGIEVEDRLEMRDGGTVVAERLLAFPPVAQHFPEGGQPEVEGGSDASIKHQTKQKN
jgi:hypothetical protein